MDDQGASAGRLRPQLVFWVSQAKNPTQGKGTATLAAVGLPFSEARREGEAKHMGPANAGIHPAGCSTATLH